MSRKTELSLQCTRSPISYSLPLHLVFVPFQTKLTVTNCRSEFVVQYGILTFFCLLWRVVIAASGDE